MKYDELTRNIGKAGLTNKEFAILIKSNPNSISNLANKDTVPKHLAIIAVLLGEMKDKGLEFEALFHRMNLEAQKPRGTKIQTTLSRNKNES